MSILALSLAVARPGAAIAQPGASTGSPPNPPADRILQFGGDREFPPFEWLDENGEPQGFQVELVRAIAAKINMQVEVRLGVWSNIREEFEEGAVDVVGMFDGPPRRDLALFGDPHTVAGSEIFVRRGEGSYHGLADLRGKRVIVQTAALAADRFAHDKIDVTLITVDTEAEAMQLLASGTGDAAVVTQLGGRQAMARYGLSNITTSGPPVLESHYALCVRKGNKELLDKLNQGLAILKRTGEYNALYDRWFGDVDRPVVSMRRLMIVGAVVLGSAILYVGASLIWTRLLRRRVDERTRQLRAELGERARVQAELERSERRLRELIEHAPEAILVIDPGHARPDAGNQTAPSAASPAPPPTAPRVTAANPRAQALFGTTRETLLSADPRRLINVDWADLDALPSAAPVEVRIRRHDGSEVDCELRVVALPDSDHTLVRASLVDVSERRRAERRQRVLIDELDHRVKNTLASIIGLTEGLVRSSGSLAEFRDSFVPRVHAMARAHEALASAKWEGVRLSQALKLVLRGVPDARARRIALTGDDPLIGPEQSMAVSLILHELTVNSIVHGALSRPDGAVELRCESGERPNAETDAAAASRIRLLWSEPPAVPAIDAVHEQAPAAIAEGFGLALVRGLVEHQLRGRVRFERDRGAYVFEINFDSDHGIAGGTPVGAAYHPLPRAVRASGERLS